MSKTSLYNLIYGMELFKSRFQSGDAYQRASLNVIAKYSEAHSNNNLIGPIDFNRINVDVDTGEIESFSNEHIGLENCTYDQWKFFPDEYYSNVGWSQAQDLYCLSVVLYVFRYYSLPFDGDEESKSYSLDLSERKESYRKNGFVFSKGSNNSLSNIIGATAASLWNDDDNQAIKEKFTRVFENRMDVNIRPGISEWEKMFANNDHDTSLKLSKEGVSIILVDGVEILKKDIVSDGDEEKIGVVVSSNKDRSVLALGNTSEATWRVDLPDGQRLSVAPKSAAPIVKGAVIDFGFDTLKII